MIIVSYNNKDDRKHRERERERECQQSYNKPRDPLFCNFNINPFKSSLGHFEYELMIILNEFEIF